MAERTEFENTLVSLGQVNPYLFFVVLCLIKGLFIFTEQDLLGYRSDFFVDISSLGNQEAETLSLLWQAKILLGYLGIPIYYLIKFLSVGLVLWLGAFGFGWRISFPFLFKLAMFSQLAFFIPDLVKILYFGFISEEYTMADYSFFRPLSLLGLLPDDIGSPFLINLADWINLGQLVFMALLAKGIQLKYSRTFKQSVYLALLSFLPASLFWVFFYSAVFV